MEKNWGDTPSATLIQISKTIPERKSTFMIDIKEINRQNK